MFQVQNDWLSFCGKHGFRGRVSNAPAVRPGGMRASSSASGLTPTVNDPLSRSATSTFCVELSEPLWFRSVLPDPSIPTSSWPVEVGPRHKKHRGPAAAAAPASPPPPPPGSGLRAPAAAPPEGAPRLVLRFRKPGSGNPFLCTEAPETAASVQLLWGERRPRRSGSRRRCAGPRRAWSYEPRSLWAPSSTAKGPQSWGFGAAGPRAGLATEPPLSNGPCSPKRQGARGGRHSHGTPEDMMAMPAR